jgi:hypothetical protein
MTLINPLTAYNNKHREIDYYYIEMLIRIAHKNGYSSQLVDCVAEAVQLKNRPTVTQILEQYKELKIGESKMSLRK